MKITDNKQIILISHFHLFLKELGWENYNRLEIIVNLLVFASVFLFCFLKNGCCFFRL